MTHAIRIHAFGDPEVLQWEEVSVGDPGPGEVRLRHRAIGINYVEVQQRRGRMPNPLPFIPGREGAGVVEALGQGVEDLAVGDRVAYAPVTGSYSEVRLIAADRLIKLPDQIDDRTAAAMMLQGMTAQYLLRQIHHVGPDDVVLVHAAAGGMGLFLCQWAAALGATVLGTVSSEAKAQLAHENGCRQPIIYAREDVPKEVDRITGGERATVVYDGVGRDTFMPSLDCLRRRGHIVSFGEASGPVPALDIGLLGRKGSLTVSRGTLLDFISTREELLATAGELFDVVVAGQVKVRINQTYPLREAAAAHRDLEGRRTTGSTILLP